MDSQINKYTFSIKSPEKENLDGITSEAFSSYSDEISSKQCSTADHSFTSVGLHGQRRPVPYAFFQPSAKRLRFEEKPNDIAQLKSSILEWRKWKLDEVVKRYNEHVMELYLHENNINILDMQNVIKNPSSQLVSFVQHYKLKGDRSLEERVLTSSPLINIKIKEEPDISPSKLNIPHGNKYRKISHSNIKQRNIVSSDGIGSIHQDQLVEKARQEAYVIQRITALRKEGLWGERKLPKIQEPSRPKAHWDYLLEEMVWLSADFAQERKWKKAAAKKCAKMVQKYFQDKEIQAVRAEKEHELKLRKIAAFVAKEVRTFWNNIGKLIEFKVNAKLDEKKKKALDQQLSFIVGQTEKYSSMLAESMRKNEMSNNPSRSETPSTDKQSSDGEFEPDETSDDNEDTIAKEDDNPEEQASEIQLLKKESEKTLDDLLNELPPEYFQDKSKSFEEGGNNMDSKSVSPSASPDEGDSVRDGDKDFEAVESDGDDEMTIEEQERKESDVNYEQELKELEAENEMSVEEIRRKYENLVAECEEPFEENDKESDVDDNSDSDVSMKSLSSDDVETEEEEEERSDDDDEITLGLEDLMNHSFTTQSEDGDESKMTKERSEEVDKELEDASAAAQALQPKGFTLSSTSVTTPIPFLLKHKLREYQHVGLDWLVTMYEKKLNGILADEMGLGKTIQTIALLAHLACEKGIWGPHLIVVPTSVMLNWEMEFKKWCPAFKILTYYGSQKERKLKRQGWTKSNAFHICITSYKLVIQDHQSFRRKKWTYFILDEAQNIKNFKSQRWQLLLNFQSHRRLLLTGTPLQNNLMELWSLMHFLMPNIFASHREFREWFSNPVTGMIEGNKEYNDNIIKRLHKVLRPFILRRLKSEVEQQMPKKFEHVVMCRLSKRQRFLYEEFMSRTKTKDTLASGNFLSVINILMQLRKVCNHPNLFEPRPTISPFMMSGLSLQIPSLVYNCNLYDPFKHVDLYCLNVLLIELELTLTAFASHRIRRFHAPQKLIQEIDSIPDPPPRCPAGKIKLHVRPSSQPLPRPGLSSGKGSSAPSIVTLKPVNTSTSSSMASTTSHSSQSSQIQTGVRFQLVQHGGTYKAIPLPPGSTGGMLMQQTPQGPRLIMPQRTLQTSVTPATTPTSASVNTSLTTASSGSSVGVGGLQLVQTSAGQYLLTSGLQKSSPNNVPSIGLSGNTAVALLQRLQGLKGLQGSVITTGAGGRPVLRLPTSSLRPSISSSSAVTTSAEIGGVLTTGSTSTSPSTLPATSPVSKLTSLSTGLQQLVSSVKSTSLSTIQLTPTLSSSVSTPTTTPVTSPIKGIQTRSQINDIKLEEPSAKKREDVQNKSIFYLNDLEEDKKFRRKDKLKFTYFLNTRRCYACPIYGSDLIEAVSVVLGQIKNACINRNSFLGQGMVHCSNSSTIDQFWYQTEALSKLVNTPLSYLSSLKDVTDRFVFCIPSVMAPLPSLRVFHPHPSLYWKEQTRKRTMEFCLNDPMKPLHSIINASMTHFPEPRLIQYDCGKLQTLDRLLRRLKSGCHRVLIFTQMTRMLDIFEVFLNFHGHLYLRLDGATKVEHRQSLMERFNQDKRIFVFILSTRSGGIGVNLTGADTVIFYDSDWNPTMDAQAQDRCHRIGQTRDVHIYRLISEKTVEENILKKANQKRLLGDLAIEGGNFTTASLKKSTVQDLFKIDINEQDAYKRMTEVLDKEKPVAESEKDLAKVGDLENALAAAEDETDVEATKVAKAEAAAELAEFDENIPLDDVDNEEISKAEQEVALLMKQLTPIEKYAMQFLEESDEGLNAEVERLAAEIEEQKKEWEMGRLQALQDEERRMKELAEDDDPLTYSAINAHNQMWVSYFNDVEIMPIWRPPTPPRDDNDLYVDKSLEYWYDTSNVMTESKLPPVYVKREGNKRLKIDTAIGINLADSSSLDSVVSVRGNIKMKREEPSFAPRSLFERRDLKREVKLFKYRTFARPSVAGLKPQQLIGKPVDSDTLTDWLVHEDWLIVQTIKQILQLPLNLSIVSLAHIPNWDLVCDLVNAFSVCFRSQRQCRGRYENVLAIREENKETASPDLHHKKLTKKQHKFLGGQGNIRGMGTFQLFQQDNNSKFSSLCSTRFETIKSITVKKTPTMKPMHINPASKNSKHAQVLLEHGIQYEEPLSPSQVATNRVERIQREKQKNQADLAQQQTTRLQLHQHSNQSQNQITVSQLQRQLQQAQQQIALVAATAAGSNTVQQSPQPQQQSVVVTAGGITGKVAPVILSQGVANNLVSAITVSGGSIVSSALVTTASSTASTTTLLSGVRAAVAAQGTAGSTGRTTLTLQDLQGRTNSTGQPTVVSVAGLSQLQAAKLTALTSQGSPQRVTGVPVQTRTLIPQQMQYLRQAQRQTLALHSGKVVATSTTGDQQTIKRVQIAGQTSTGQKVQVAVSGATVPGITAIQMVKPGTMVATASTSTGNAGNIGKTVTRTVTESEMNALLRRQPPQIAKVGQIAQMLAKQRSLVGVKGATVGLQLSGKAGLAGTGLGTVQIVQGGTQKQMTVQQIQQVFKQVQQQQQQQSQIIQQGTISGTVVGKAALAAATGGSGSASNASNIAAQAGLSGQTSKLIPVTVVNNTQQSSSIKQTIQVVSASSTGGATASSSGITIQGNAVRVASPTLLSLGPANVHRQPVSVAVRNPTSGGAAVKIQTSTTTSHSPSTIISSSAATIITTSASLGSTDVSESASTITQPENL